MVRWEDIVGSSDDWAGHDDVLLDAFVRYGFVVVGDLKFGSVGARGAGDR
jgi:hypothetical protein